MPSGVPPAPDVDVQDSVPDVLLAPPCASVLVEGAQRAHLQCRHPRSDVGDLVVPVGLVVASQLNGQVGTIKSWDLGVERFGAALPEGPPCQGQAAEPVQARWRRPLCSRLVDGVGCEDGAMEREDGDEDDEAVCKCDASPVLCPETRCPRGQDGAQAFN